MTAAMGVLCTRVRVEEKQLIAALAEAGVAVLPIAPNALPLPVGPDPNPSPTMPTPGSGVGAWGMGLLIDRCQDRNVAAATLPLWRAGGARTLDAGLAATGSRLDIASALAAAGLPRPLTRLVCSPDAALAVLDEVGEPATLFPLTPGAAGVPLLDRDTAEAVVEHRAVLGGSIEAVALIQAGAPHLDDCLTLTVVGERAVAAIDWRNTPRAELARAAALAERVAAVLGATLIDVSIAAVADGLIVWDVHPVPEYRHATPLGDRSVAGAIADLAVGRPLARAVRGSTVADPGDHDELDHLIRIAAEPGSPEVITIPGGNGHQRQEVGGGIALTA